MGRVNLVAVQPRMERGDYRDARAFRAKVAALMDGVRAAADTSLPTLVSFPELIGMFLSFLPRYWEQMRDAPTLEAAGRALLAEHYRSLPAEEHLPPKEMARKLMYFDGALEAEATFTEAFADAARGSRCYVSAGSIGVPVIESEPSRGGRFVADGSKLYNMSYLFSPRGVCISRVPKAYPTPGLEAGLFDGAPLSELLPAETAIGRIGTLVCFDGFHETLVERYDAAGVQVLLQPSYNQHAWDGPSTYDPAHGEGENWLRTACPAIIQGRENIRYGVNAMLVGAVFEDMLAEGISTIAVNTGRVGASLEDAVLARAQKPDAEETVAATVEL